MVCGSGSGGEVREGLFMMRVQIINIDNATRKQCKVYHWKIYEVIRVRIIELPPRKTPSYRKEYLVKDDNSPTGKLLLYWYEVKEL